MKERIIPRFPGFVAKAVSFTIDDGNIPMDKKLLDIVKPFGIKGTFNLCSDRLTYLSPEEYREFYRRYGIANHCAHHPAAYTEGVEYTVAEGKFDPETADKSKLYKSTIEGYYHACLTQGWRMVACDETYLAFAEESRKIIKEIFGNEYGDAFVWPFGEQKNGKLKASLAARYGSLRKTGCLLDSTGFALPADRSAWTYNAHHGNILNVMKKFAEYPDDGELKLFTFGVHSVDFENAGCWGNLEEFAKTYGNRPEEFYYATIDEIFNYEDAVKALHVYTDRVYNPSNITLYFEYNGAKYTVAPGATVAL